MNLVRKYFVLFALALGYSASYMLPYIKYVFYDQLLQGVGCNNEQAGFLLTVYTIAALILYIPGGWVADRFKTKSVLVVSLFATGVINFAFALNMNYTFALVTWVLLAFSTAFAFWAGIIKAIRLLGSAAEQGRLYGFFSSGVGAFSAVTSSIALYVYGLFTADAVGGLKGVIYVQGATCILSSLIVYFFFEESKETTAVAEEDKFKASDILLVLKNPMTWALSCMIFCGYGIYTSTSYFNPYMTKVIGVTMTFSGLLAIVRTYVVRLTCGPLGGIFADKLKSPSQVLIGCFALMVAILVIFMLLPVGTSAAVVIALQLILAAVTSACYSILFSCIEEVGIPRKLTGTTVAITSMIGYLPDMIYNPLFGAWLDRHGNTGYLYIFTFLAVSGALGLGSAILIRRHNVTSAKAASQPA